MNKLLCATLPINSPCLLSPFELDSRKTKHSLASSNYTNILQMIDLANGIALLIKTISRVNADIGFLSKRDWYIEFTHFGCSDYLC